MSEKSKTYHIHTFGCQMNFHDSEKMAGLLEANGMSRAGSRDEADLIVFNTCSIRQKAEQKFLSELGRLKGLKRKRPGMRIAVAGCIAQQMGEDLLRRAGHVDFILGPQNIHAVAKMAQEEVRAAALEANPELALMELPAIRNSWPRAWVNIMYGCDNFCTYCIVPYTRGREVSRPSKSIFEEISGLAKEGFKEVTLLGQNVNSYRSDTDFPGLLRKVHPIEGIERIRFVTSHPRDLSHELVECMRVLSKLCECIHLPLQSGSDRVLKAMNRGYTYSEYAGKVKRLREAVPGVAITTDIIAGFPGETAEDHELTLKAIREIEFDGMFAFKYSARPGTKAALMEGQLPDEVKGERLADILRVQDEITLRKNRVLEGSVQEVLVEGLAEKGHSAQLTGRTRTNKIVNFEGADRLKGETLRVRIKRAGLHSLDGDVLD